MEARDSLNRVYSINIIDKLMVMGMAAFVAALLFVSPAYASMVDDESSLSDASLSQASEVVNAAPESGVSEGSSGQGVSTTTQEATAPAATSGNQGGASSTSGAAASATTPDGGAEGTSDAAASATTPDGGAEGASGAAAGTATSGSSTEGASGETTGTSDNSTLAEIAGAINADTANADKPAAPKRRQIVSSAAPKGATPDSAEGDSSAGKEIETGDFAVSISGSGASYEYKDGVLTVKNGSVTVANKNASVATTNRIVVAGDSTINLAGVNIKAAKDAAIKILAGAKAILHLNDGTENTVTGGNGHAGVEVDWESSTNFAHLVIDGSGSLKAVGGDSGAGIGGSKSAEGLYGDITINGGTIEARGTNRSAGIGSSDNPSDGESHGSYHPNYNETWGAITINDGDVKAYGVGNGAGIGGGNHTSSGKIVINGGTVYAEGDSGIGSGLGSSGGADKGPGYYYADVEINGGNVTAYATDNMGAGIGGGMYSDAYVTITGGTVKASVNTSGNEYQGGAGIGAGYQGVAVVTITGGTVEAHGGNGSAGIGNGALAASTTSSSYTAGVWSGVKNVRAGKYAIPGEKSGVHISGGDVTAYGGKYGAGIGTGNCAEWCNVVISGGTVKAYGYTSDNEEMAGGAGVGSGVRYVGDKKGYMKTTDTVGVVISGGNVFAIGGWGAAGIGSGADNTQAFSVSIDNTKANVQAYSDGTKFAIDTRVLGDDGLTTSANNTSIGGNMLQGTFVHAGTIGDYDQSPEGLNSIVIENELTGEVITLTQMPKGYRSFATTVANAGNFTVFTDSESIGHGQGRYFVKTTKDVWNVDDVVERDAHYVVKTGKLADNFYLFPVKAVVVTKVIEGIGDVDISKINKTFYFALWMKDENRYYTRKDGSIWVESIEVVNGVPQKSAMFIGVDDNTYGVWEVADAQGNDFPRVNNEHPYLFDSKDAYQLVGITTKDSSGGSDNDAVLGGNVWTDKVVVVNTFANIPAPDQPASESEQTPEPDPTPTPEPDPTPTPEPEQPVEVIEDDPAPLALASTTTTRGAPAAPARGARIVGLATPFGGVPIAFAAEAIEDDATPLAETIEDDETPMASGHDHGIWCWVHWWILLGMLLTAIYSVIVIVRRRNNSHKHAKIDRGVMGGTSKRDEAPTAPSPSSLPHPAM